MRYLIPALLASLVALLGLAGTADAQIVTSTPTRPGCDPRPQLYVNYTADGWVTVSVEQTQFRPDNVITKLDVYATTDGWPIAVDLPNGLKGLQPNPTLSLDYLQAGGNPLQFRFQLHVLLQTGGAAHVPITVTDLCGARPSFVGSGGSGMIPYATATYTPTRTPSPTSTPTFIPTSTPTRTPTVTPSPTRTFTPIPSATIVPTATATPNAAHVFANPSVLRAGDVFDVGWVGVGAPTTTDWVGLYHQGGADNAWVGSQIYTSSCTAAPGTGPLATGGCLLRIDSSTTTGYYDFRLFRGSGIGSKIATSGLIELRADIAATAGEGQLYGTRYWREDPEICPCSPNNANSPGYLGVYAQLQEPWLPYVSNGDIASQVGLTREFYEAVFAQGFAEAGIVRQCPGPQYGFLACDAFPYASWENSFGVGQTVIWNGQGHSAVYISPYEHYQFQVFSDQGFWHIQMCGSIEYGGPCCELWWYGQWCVGDQSAYPPSLGLSGFPRLFCGQESASRAEPAGDSYCGHAEYCCKQWPVWDNWRCFDGIPWVSYNTTRLGVINIPPVTVDYSIGPCTTAGWPVRSWARSQ